LSKLCLPRRYPGAFCGLICRRDSTGPYATNGATGASGGKLDWSPSADQQALGAGFVSSNGVVHPANKRGQRGSFYGSFDPSADGADADGGADGGFKQTTSAGAGMGLDNSELNSRSGGFLSSRSLNMSAYGAAFSRGKLNPIGCALDAPPVEHGREQSCALSHAHKRTYAHRACATRVRTHARTHTQSHACTHFRLPAHSSHAPTALTPSQGQGSLS
jgi:hypothetical protein